MSGFTATTGANDTTSRPTRGPAPTEVKSWKDTDFSALKPVGVIPRHSTEGKERRIKMLRPYWYLNNGIATCDCGITTSRVGDIDRHIAHKHFKVIQYKCAFLGCAKVGSNKSYLQNDHFRSIHGGDPHKCPTCTVGFPDKSALVKHQRREHPEAGETPAVSERARRQGTREMPSDGLQGTREMPLDGLQGTREMPLDGLQGYGTETSLDAVSEYNRQQNVASQQAEVNDFGFNNNMMSTGQPVDTGAAVQPALMDHHQSGLLYPCAGGLTLCEAAQPPQQPVYTFPNLPNQAVNDGLYLADLPTEAEINEMVLMSET